MPDSLTPKSISKPILHFAHANSFPAGTYAQFFTQLSPHYDVQALELHAHDPAFPVTNGWELLAQELIATLEARYTAPVILVGHSLGGLLALIAAHFRPDLVRCVVILDSPIIAGWRALVVKCFKLLRRMKQHSPARFSEKRRQQWSSPQGAYQHFSAKAIFAAWPKEVLRDYIRSGFVENADGVELRFKREIETQIYLTIPDHLGALTRSPPSVPIGFVGGTESFECRQAGLAATKRLVGKHFVQIPAGHLLPLEVPEQTAAAVHAMIQSLLSQQNISEK